MDRYICIHGHFYQPPRENPWTEEVETEDSAYPYHDWNERITAECYGPNTASRILDPDGVVVDIVNNYSRMSFNFGPTLLTWLQKKAPEVYDAVIQADRESMELFSGHGSAIAQAYNHIILPLADSRDKRTQIIWGIRDFRYRFKRDPEGMWLPETAVDLETLQILSEEGIVFTILSPYQASGVRRLGSGRSFRDVSGGRVDPTRPYLVKLPSGRQIVVFFYDGPISRDIAFGGLLNNGEEFAKRLLAAFNDQRRWPQIVHTATDGETFGHHHRGGDMALAYCLYYIQKSGYAEITNYGAYLERYFPEYEAQIIENTSWSCFHGVKRWADDCGCHTGVNPGWSQAWRRPLRKAMDMLRDRLRELFEREAGSLLKDPWLARDEYITVVLDRRRETVLRYLQDHAIRPLWHEEIVKVLKLLEMQRQALLMYTSCGWFFDEISGIETLQVMKYAARAMQLAREVSGVDLETEFLQILKTAPSNVYRNGAEVYERFVKTAEVDLLRVGAHYAISSLFEDYPEEVQIYQYRIKAEEYNLDMAGRQRFLTGRARVTSEVTWQEQSFSFTVFSLGDHNITAGLCPEQAPGTATAQAEIREAFRQGSVADVIRLIDRHFRGHVYSLWHLFRDEQRRIVRTLLEETFQEMDSFYRDIYEDNYQVMSFLLSIDSPVPKSFLMAAEHTLNRELLEALESGDLQRLEALVQECQKWGIQVSRESLSLKVAEKAEELMRSLRDAPEETVLLEELYRLLRFSKDLRLEPNLWKTQNLYFSLGKVLLPDKRKLLLQRDRNAQRWVEIFRKVGYSLHVKVPSG